MVRVDLQRSLHVGTFTGAYRGTQLQGNGLRGRLGLVAIPEYLAKTSFPYMKRPYAEEIPFVDTISVVRFLGGWNPQWTWGEAGDDIKKGDLAYVDDSGRVRYRWELVAPRLDPYLRMGYKDLILSLDNVPHDLAAYESQGHYGQIAPPRDYREWQAFIEALCRHLVTLYGFDLPNSWAFRMGTENNGAARGSKHTFDGDHDQWIKLYDHTAAAVKRVLPGAAFGPGEFGGGVSATGPEPPKVNYVKLAEHCAGGVNAATGRTGAPLDFLANSSHAVPRWRNGHLVGCVNPNDRIKANLWSYGNVLGKHEQFNAVPIYIFQFGFLNSEFDHGGSLVATTEPGGRGAAWAFHVIVGMKAREPRLKGLWHWGAMDSLPTGRGRPAEHLLKGNGWLYAILDHCRGGDAVVPTIPDSPDGTTYMMLFVARDESYYLVTSAFNVDRNNDSAKQIAIAIPKTLMTLRGEPDIGAVRLTDRNAVHRVIKDDLAAAGLLEPEFARFAPLLASVRRMGGRRGVRFVVNRVDNYKRHIVDSLVLKPFDGRFAETADGHTVTFSVRPGSVTAIAFNHRPARRHLTGDR